MAPSIGNNPFLLYLATALLGLIVGSFLNVVIVRLPGMLERGWRQQCRELLELEAEAASEPVFNLVRPRSHCPHCGAAVRPVHNIPLLSYLWLKGRCAHCAAGISVRYPVIEALAALLAIMAAAVFGLSWQLAGALVLGWGFLAMSAIDIEHQLLPDDMVLPLLWIGLFANAFGLYTDLQSAVFGALAGYVSLWLVFQVFLLVTGKEGMGHGDFKLFACIGAWLGWQALPLVILLASLCGAIVGLALIGLKGRDRAQPIPFGPFLCAAGFTAMLWGPQIMAAYLQTSGIRY